MNNDSRNRRISGGVALAALPGLIFLFLFFFIPLLTILSGAFINEAGEISLLPLLASVRDENLLRILGFTFLQAFLSSLIALAMGLPGAYFIARCDFPGKKILRSLSVVPFVIPPILVVLGFVTIFGNNGIINRFLMQLTGSGTPPLKILYSLKGILLAHGFYNFPVVLRIVASHWEAIPEKQEQAAQLLGAKRSAVFRTITLPQLMPAVVSSMLLVFLFCFSSFAVVMVLGGGPKTTTIEVEIFRLARINLDLQAAGRVALIAACLTLLPLLLNFGTESRFTGIGASDRDHRIVRGRNPKVRLLGAVYGLAMVILVIGPLLGVVASGFLEVEGPLAAPRFSLRWFAGIFAVSGPDTFSITAARSIAGSLLLSGLTLLITIPTATLFALATVRSGGKRAKLFELTASLPMSISTVILGSGYLAISVAYPMLTSVPLFIAGAHSVIAFPFVYRSIVTALAKIDGSYRRAAISLGARPAKAFADIELPMLESSLFSAAAFAFALSVGEMNATLTLSGGSFPTLPITIYRLIGSYQFHRASALGTVLIVLCAVAFLLLDRSTRKKKEM